MKTIGESPVHIGGEAFEYYTFSRKDRERSTEDALAKTSGVGRG
jgi:hypothetical protein